MEIMENSYFEYARDTKFILQPILCTLAAQNHPL